MPENMAYEESAKWEPGSADVRSKVISLIDGYVASIRYYVYYFHMDFATPVLIPKCYELFLGTQSS